MTTEIIPGQLWQTDRANITVLAVSDDGVYCWCQTKRRDRPSLSPDYITRRSTDVRKWGGATLVESPKIYPGLLVQHRESRRTYKVRWCDDTQVLIGSHLCSRQAFKRTYRIVGKPDEGDAVNHIKYGGGLVLKIADDVAFVDFADTARAVPLDELTACPPSRTYTSDSPKEEY